LPKKLLYQEKKTVIARHALSRPGGASNYDEKDRNKIFVLILTTGKFVR
jgi:hypothetical protein